MNNFKIYHLPVIITTVLLLFFCTLFSGCYTLKQGAAMLSYLNQAIPLEQVDDKEFVQLVMDIRKFAAEDLGLTMSLNYTQYVELDRNYLAAVVSASAKDSFQRHEWSFPIVGRMPYKGFFNIEDARKEAAKLENMDMDVWIRGVEAFSTLGWFKDPLYSYMRNYSPARLAELIIHEQVHATIFIKGQVQFNEELAEFIGSEGARLFMEKHYGIDSEEYREMFTSSIDSRNYIEFIQELIAELNLLYTSNLDREKILMEKERIINAAKQRFEAEYENRFTSDNYRFFIDLPVNNAYLELFRLYYAEDNFYKNLYEQTLRESPSQTGTVSDLHIFIAAAKTITSRGNPREQLVNALLVK